MTSHDTVPRRRREEDDVTGHEGTDVELPFSVRVRALSGASVHVDDLFASTRLIVLRRRAAQALNMPWYEITLCLGEAAFGFEQDGKTLQLLGVGEGVELACVRQTTPAESSGWIALDDAAADPFEAEVVYETHDNGGRPFTAKVLRFADRRGRVDVNEKGLPGTITFEAQGVFVGRWKLRNEGRWGEGNSLLLRMPDADGGVHRYVFVGHIVYCFETRPQDPILHYFSLVGNSDVPYPVALGAERVYYMLDCRSALRTDVGEPEEFERWEDAYCGFYDEPARACEPFVALSYLWTV